MLSIPKQIQSKLLIYKFFYIFEDNLKLQSTLFLKNLDKIITKPENSVAPIIYFRIDKELVKKSRL